MRTPGFYPTWLEAIAPGLDTERELAMIVRHLDLKPGESVLDIGCGPGRFAPGLVRYGCHYLGIDGNEQFIEQARASSPPNPEAIFVLGDAVEELVRPRLSDAEEPYLFEGLDAAFSWLASLGYSGEAADRRLFEAVLGALRPGGRFLIHVLDPQMPLGPVTLIHESKGGPVLAEVCDGLDRETNLLHARHYYLTVDGERVEGIFEETSQQLYDAEKLRTMLLEANFDSAEFRPAAPPFYLCIGYKE